MEQRTPASDTARMGDISKAVLERMTWEWQDREKLVQSLTRRVPPGKALRKYEQVRENAPARKRVELSEDEKIYSGARNIVIASFGTLAATGRIEFVDGLVRFKERRADVGKAREENGCCPACLRPFSVAPTSRKTAKAGPPTSNLIRFPVTRRFAEMKAREA